MIQVALPNGGTLTYLRRGDWGAGPLRRGNAVPETQFKGLVLHHTVREDPFKPGDAELIVAYMKWLQVVRKEDLGPEVPYSFVVFEGETRLDAVVCEGRGAGVTGAHTRGLNSTRYGVAIADDTRFEDPSDGMVMAIRWVGATFLKASQERTQPHHETSATLCPGSGGDKIMGRIQPPFRLSEFGANPTQPPTKPPPVVPVVSPYLGLEYTVSGPRVERWQHLLNAVLKLQGSDGRVPVGVFDGMTDAVTRNFQDWRGITVDGIVGDTTEAHMAAAVKAEIASEYFIDMTLSP